MDPVANVEDRLNHFLQWLAGKGVVAVVMDGMFALTDGEVNTLIEEYVNG